VNAVALSLALAQGASGLVSGVTNPFLGAWLANKGLSASAIGALMAAGMLLRVAFVPLSGIAADARNDRRGMMLLMYVIMLAGYGTLSVVITPALLFLCVIPALIAVGAANPLLESVCVRLSTRFGFDYGHVRLWASSFFVFANIASGALISWFGFVVVAPWLLAASALNVAAVYALPAPPVDHPKMALGPRMRSTWSETRELLRSPIFFLFLAGSGLAQGSHAFYYAFGGLHWRALGYSGALIGVIWPIGVFAEIGFMAISLKLFRRGVAPRIGRHFLRRALDASRVRPAAAGRDCRAASARRHFRADAFGCDVFRAAGRAAASRRDGAKSLCRRQCRDRDGNRDMGIRPALRKLWRQGLSADVGDGADLCGLHAAARPRLGRSKNPRGPSRRRPGDDLAARKSFRIFRQDLFGIEPA